MADDAWRDVIGGDEELPELDTTVAHSARIYDYWLGGKDNFASDREAAEQVRAAYPDVIKTARAERDFLANAVRYLAEQEGVRQFLDIGTGIPTANNTHEVAQAVAPECRVVYVDNDSMVLTHARALLTSTTGLTTYLHADLRDTGKILDGATRLLDFEQPIAVMLLGVLHMIPAADEPYAIVRRLCDAVPSGSWLAVAHIANDIKPEEVAAASARLNELRAEKETLRNHAEISRFFDGLEILEPGVVQMHRWRPGYEASSDEEIAAYCGLARKR